MYEDCEELGDIVSVDELLTRWPAVTEGQLARSTKKKTLQAYLLQSPPLQGPDGQKVHYCVRVDGPYERWAGDEVDYDWSDIVFDLQAVEDHEKAFPKLRLLKPIKREETAPEEEARPAPPTEMEFFTAQELCDRWSIGPAKLVEWVRSNSDLPVYWRTNYDDIPF